MIFIKIWFYLIRWNKNQHRRVWYFKFWIHIKREFYKMCFGWLKLWIDKFNVIVQMLSIELSRKSIFNCNFQWFLQAYKSESSVCSLGWKVQSMSSRLQVGFWTILCKKCIWTFSFSSFGSKEQWTIQSNKYIHLSYVFNIFSFIV